MEWEFGPLFAKAKLYAGRANEEKIDSALFGFWMSLCTELLARSALARIHPVLIADPTSEANIHYVFGINPKSNPRSVHAKTVFARCAVFIEKFNDSMAGHCLLLADRRNKELHGGDAAFEGIDPASWLPRTYEIFSVLLSHCDLSLEDLLGKDHASGAEKMLDDRGASIEKDVKDRISHHKKQYEALSGEEKAEKAGKAAKAITKWLGMTPLGRSADCPSCGFAGALHGESINRGPVQISDDNGTIIREVRVLPNKFGCVVCSLHLDGFKEITIAGLGGIFTSTEEEDPVEFFGIDPEEYVDVDKIVQEYYAEEMYGYQNE